MIELASCDSQGSLYIDESDVYRVINATSLNQVLRMVTLFGSGFNGLIDTAVCDDEMIPECLRKNNLPSLVLKHKKIPFISYPHEWCAAMLQDSAIFHLKFSEDLLKIGVHLKDAHPWNILFDQGSPVFIDFTSLAFVDDLFEEGYLESNKTYKHSSNQKRTAELVLEIYLRLFQPYFFNPLLCYRFGNRDLVRFAIQNSTLNVFPKPISLEDCAPQDEKFMLRLKKHILLLKMAFVNKVAYVKLRKNMDVDQFFRKIRANVESFSVNSGASSYSAYYRNKNEDVGWELSEDWNQKQKAVYYALNSPAINSVLDVACNTGWYSLMAEKLGKKVVAFDIDEGCVEQLYFRVKKGGLNILPLVMNFTRLTEDQFSMHDGKKVIISAVDRLQSDSVMALGILHHLVLGLGMSFDEALNPLIKLAKKQIIIEFVGRDDPVITDEPEFFPAYFQDKEILNQYSLDGLVKIIKNSGFEVSLAESFPSTRKILVCNSTQLR